MRLKEKPVMPPKGAGAMFISFQGFFDLLKGHNKGQGHTPL